MALRDFRWVFTAGIEVLGKTMYGKGIGFIFHHEIEGQLVGDRVEVVVVCKFHMGNFVSSGSRVRSTKDPQIGFNFLVDSFNFSIKLRMIPLLRRQTGISPVLGGGLLPSSTATPDKFFGCG